MSTTPNVPWYRELTRYHWFVLAVAALGWLFDTMDQQLFVLARSPAMAELLDTTDKQLITEWGGYVTSLFLIGWATGGLFFGMLGDKIGRARTMMLTILIYSACTGLSALSVGVYDFAVYRFLTGLGVGGEFAVGVSLVAEVMPDYARPFALGLLQALSAVGNVTAAVINMVMGQLESNALISTGHAWRYMFVVGAVPALLALFIRRRLKEPERWVQMRAEQGSGKKLGSYAELFETPMLRKRAIIGVTLASSGVIGLWAIGFFSPELVRSALDSKFSHLSPADKEAQMKLWTGIASIMLNIGAFFGIYAFSRITHHLGRRPTFALAFLAALGSTVLAFATLREFSQIFWMIPLMGFCQLSIFGGYAIYFPELFPTRLRSTGTSVCYNVGRYVAAFGPPVLGLLTNRVFNQEHGFAPDEAIRYAGVAMCSIFLLGLAVLPFAPETRGQPLPE